MSEGVEKQTSSSATSLVAVPDIFAYVICYRKQLIAWIRQRVRGKLLICLYVFGIDHYIQMNYDSDSMISRIFQLENPEFFENMVPFLCQVEFICI